MNDGSETALLVPIHLSRRRFLGLGGAAAVGAGLVLAGCGSDSASQGSTGATVADADATSATDATPAAPTVDSTIAASSTAGSSTAAADTASTVTTAASDLTSGTPSTTMFTAADFAALGTCLLLPDLTQGPYPTISQIERRDITEGLGGHPLRVGVQVVDESCVAIPGAVVEIWHCDVDGDYSAYADGYTDDDAGEGTTFFRGSQTANADGIVEFLTSYPGWYTGRAVHIHAKVRIDDATVLTTQFLFDDELNSEILTEAAYATHGEPDTTNATDGVTGGTAEEDGLIMTVGDDTEISGSRALIVVGIDPTATSSGAAGGGMGGGGGGGQPPGG